LRPLPGWRESLLHSLLASPTYGPGKRGIKQKVSHRLGNGSRICGRNRNQGIVVPRNFSYCAHGSCDDWHSGSHRFKNYVGHLLGQGWVDK
jgi:hypothetical protein